RLGQEQRAEQDEHERQQGRLHALDAELDLEPVDPQPAGEPEDHAGQHREHPAGEAPRAPPPGEPHAAARRDGGSLRGTPPAPSPKHSLPSVRRRCRSASLKTAADVLMETCWSPSILMESESMAKSPLLPLAF